MATTRTAGFCLLLLVAGCASTADPPPMREPQPVAKVRETSVPAEPPRAGAAPVQPPAAPGEAGRVPDRAVTVPPPAGPAAQTAPPARAITPPETASPPPGTPKIATAPATIKPPAKAERPSASPTAPKKPAAPPAADARQPSAPTLDLKSLETRLKETNAIGLMTKLTLKGQVEDLLDRFRAYHDGKARIQLTELRQPYDSLILKVLALLQDKDPSLAGAIARSREAIWAILADRAKFSNL